MINKVLSNINKSIWKDDVPDDIIFEICNKYVSDIEKDITKNNVLHRVVGQSGSGKTTQVSSALQEVAKFYEKTPFVLAVRNFSLLHPDYESLVFKHGLGLIREKTNGFALKCLCVTLSLMLKKQMLIILEVTFLDKWFEAYVIYLKNLYNYEMIFHCLAVNKKVSNDFIDKRFKNQNGAESGRVTLKKSSLYFYKKMLPAYKLHIKVNKSTRIVLWGAFLAEPLYDGLIGKSLPKYLKGRSIKNINNHIKFNALNNSQNNHSDILFQQKLKCAKIEYYKNHLSF